MHFMAGNTALVIQWCEKKGVEFASSHRPETKLHFFINHKHDLSLTWLAYADIEESEN